MTKRKTVEVTLTWCPPGAPFDFDKTVDTGLTREEWDAMSPAAQDRLMQPSLDAFVLASVEKSWNAIDLEET